MTTPTLSPSAMPCLLHAVVASISLWAQGVVTESRLVPSIDVLARSHGVPDDVAGATLIAAGASSPEFLCTLVSLFITRSGLGLGTIVGSEVFNLLVISAGSLHAAEERELRLERRVVMRDAGFYALSIAMLRLALGDVREVYVIGDDVVAYHDEDAREERRIFVQFWKACLLSGLYVMYVTACVVDFADVARRIMACSCLRPCPLWEFEGRGGPRRRRRRGDVGLDDDDSDGRDHSDRPTVTTYALDTSANVCDGDDDKRKDFDGIGRTTEEPDDKYNDGRDDERDSSNADDDAYPRRDDLIRKPRNASKIELGLWFFLYPLRLIMHYTIPDVRRRKYSSYYHAYLSTASCLVWLCVSSYVMVTSLESLAAFLGMPDSVMGATVSAAGTSYPAYVASRMAVVDGMGNRAVSNILGSNTFNICVGLGVPWMVYILSMGLRPYTDLEDVGVVESMVVLLGTLLIFVVLLASTDFVLVKWQANLFLGLYILYIIYTIGEVYW